MVRRFAIIFSILTIAFGILFASVLKAANLKPQPSSLSSSVLAASEDDEEEKFEIDYILPFPGRVLPDNPLWYLKAARDKLWLFLIFDPGKKAELKLLFADKRLWGAKMLFEKGKLDLGVISLTKAEKYLEEAGRQEKKNRELGIETKDFLTKLAKASLKHRQTIKDLILIAPEDLRPEIIKAENYPKNVYKESRDALNSKSLAVPNNPFDQE